MEGETTWSFLQRVAARYGMDAGAPLGWWTWLNHRPQAEGGGVRPDAEILFNPAGGKLLATVSGAEPASLARALPSWAAGPADFAGQAGDEEPLARWRMASAVGGPTVFGCRLCTARRSGRADAVVRYVPPWRRVCGRHQRWLLDAEVGHGLERLDLRGLPEVVAAQRRWAGVAGRASRAGVEPERVFALAYAVACRWWEQALEWERERVWPARLHAVAGGDASADGRFWWWRAIGRDAVVFPEVMVLADALLDPDMAGLAWADSGAEHPRPLPADGAFGRELGQRVGRPWLGPLATADYGGPLSAWMGATIRRRRGVKRPGGYADDPWRVKQEHQPVTAAAQLRALAKNAAAAGSGTLWRSAVPAEQRMVITARVDDAAEQLAGLRGTQTGTAREAGRLLLTTLARSIGLLEEALLQTADAALEAGVPLADLADWTGIAPEALADGLKEYGRRVR